MQTRFELESKRIVVTSEGSDPLVVAIEDADPDSNGVEFEIAPQSAITVGPDDQALLALVPLLTPDEETLELLMGTDESFYSDDASVHYGESTGVTINGEHWSWLETRDSDDDGIVLIPGDIRAVATFRLVYGPSGDPGHVGVVHRPPVSIFRDESIDMNTMRVSYGLSLRSAIEQSLAEIVDERGRWGPLEPWCPACGFETLWDREIFIPEVFEVEFAASVDTEIISDVVTPWWMPCTEHAGATFDLGGRTFHFDGVRWVTSG